MAKNPRNLGFQHALVRFERNFTQICTAAALPKPRPPARPRRRKCPSWAFSNPNMAKPPSEKHQSMAFLSYSNVPFKPLPPLGVGGGVPRVELSLLSENNTQLLPVLSANPPLRFILRLSFLSPLSSIRRGAKTKTGKSRRAAITPKHLLLHEAQPAHPAAERDGTQ